MRRVMIAVLCGEAALAGCSSSTKKSAAPTAASTSAASTSTTKPKPATTDSQVWLCKPGESPNPCTGSLDETVVAADGTKTVKPASVAKDPKIDCFYVYPTVSTQPTPNSTLEKTPAEIGVAQAQAARYSQVCNVYAPMYRQVTISGIGHRNPKASAIAQADVVKAWHTYLDRYNDGRGVVLIGHSQGAGRLTALLASEIEKDPAQKKLIVSALMLGGGFSVPAGKDVGGSSTQFPACHAANQTGCVIAYSTFNEHPPANSLFGRSRTPGQEVLCTNPAALGGGSGALLPAVPSHEAGLFALVNDPSATTQWVTYPDLFTAHCENKDGFAWLQVDDVRKAGDARPKLMTTIGPSWGLHLWDGNIALDNLVDDVRRQADAYTAANP
jgi:Protein of unknown function (DUF3089)